MASDSPHLPDRAENTPADADNEQIPAPPRPPVRKHDWRRRSALAAVMTGVAKGFQFVFEPKQKEEQKIVREASDPEDDNDKYSVSLNADRPEDTVIRFRAPGDDEDNDDEHSADSDSESHDQ